MRYILSKIITISLISQIIFLSTIGICTSVNSRSTDEAFSSDEKQTGGVEKINVTFESGNYTLYGEIYYPSEKSQTYPGIIFCEGGGAYISAYNWIPNALAKEGYVVFIFDFPGQGKSEGIYPNRGIYIKYLNLFLRFSSSKEASIHYKSGTWTKTISNAITYLTEESPIRNIVDKTKIGLIGHSLGGIAVTDAVVQDKRVNCIVVLYHGNFTNFNKINIPIQFQDGTFDVYSAPPVVLYSYRKARTPKEVIIISSGTHLGFTTILGPLCPCPKWQKDICLRYTIGWFDYFLKNKPDAYTTITTGTDHLSKIIKSRYNFGDGEHILKTTNLL
jgi:dienelactone hydrolase